MENTVDTMQQGIVLDDAAQAQAEEDVSPLSSILEEPQTEKPETEQAPAKEPGWIKQRVNAAVTKAEARIRAEYEAKLAPLYESMMDREAQELVRTGEFKTLERAKEYVRLKNGMPAERPVPEQEQQPSRDAQGRFAPKEQTADEDPVVQARAELLAKQAQKIKQNTGLDVMQALEDPEIKQKIIGGEWDFHDVAEHLRSGQGRKVPPLPIRSPNGAKVGTVSIMDMPKEQFDRLQESLQAGRRFDMR